MEKAIREGRMTRPGTQIAYSDRIDILGTCPDMCPRFERVRRDRFQIVDKLELVSPHRVRSFEILTRLTCQIPGTRSLDHNKAVKMYERGAGDKWQPADIRPAIVCKASYITVKLAECGSYRAI